MGFLTSSSSQISLSGCQSRQIGGADEVENLVKLETEEFDLQKSLGSYPIQSQNRLNNVIQIYANSPDPEQTQDFWQMILHKGIPTIHTISDLDPGKILNLRFQKKIKFQKKLQTVLPIFPTAVKVRNHAEFILLNDSELRLNYR